MSVLFEDFDESSARKYERWYYTPGGQKSAQAEIIALRNAIKKICQQSAQLSILEIGCGTGYFARALCEANHTVVGVDYSLTMLKVARENQKTNLWYVAADAQSLPFPAQSFDVSLFITSLEFIAEPELALKEARRVSRGGIVLLLLNPYHWINLRRWLKSWLKPSVFRSAHFYSPLTIKKRLGSWLYARDIPRPSISVQFSLTREFYLVLIPL